MTKAFIPLLALFNVVFLYNTYAGVHPKPYECYEKVVVHKSNGGPSGWNDIYEEHSKPIIGENVHTLTCQDPGNSSCSWSTPPSAMALIGYAEQQIANGTMEGSSERNISGIHHTIEWNATDASNAHITETIDNGQ